MPRSLHLEVAARRTGGTLRRDVLLRLDGETEATRVSYEIVGHSREEYPASLDGFVFGLLFRIMKVGAPLRVHGPLSRTALYNLEELQAFWTLWCPDAYKPVEIIPDRVVDLVRSKPGRRAIAAFSGGVDSTFTILRHRGDAQDGATHAIDTVLMVQGFDVALANARDFERLVVRSEALRRELALDLRIVRTNSKELNLQKWEDSFGGQLAACLHQFADEFEFGMVGSSEPYDHLYLPWGSNPVTDPLLSGDAFAIVHDGAGYSRTDKAAIITRYPLAMPGLKVCWEGQKQDRNCGVCEKCMRTRLNFLAVGEPNPACFDEPLDASGIDGIVIRNQAQYLELQSIVEYAEHRGKTGPWLGLLRRRLQRYRREEAAQRRRERIGLALEAIGMKRVASRALHSLGLSR